VDVQPRLGHLAGRPVGVEGERVTDWPELREVRDRERLQAAGKCSNVVPAGEVLGADQGDALGVEDALNLLGEVVHPHKVFDHLVGVNDGEGLVRERPGSLEVGAVDGEAPAFGEVCIGGDDLDRSDLIRWDANGAADRVGPGSVLAAEIEQPGPGIAGNELEESPAVIGFGLGPQPFAVGLEAVHRVAGDRH